MRMFEIDQKVKIKNCCGNPNATILLIAEQDQIAVVLLENEDPKQGHVGVRFVHFNFLITI
jgi:hypothetical protein